MTSNRHQAEITSCCDIAVQLEIIYFIKSYILQVQFRVLIILCCRLLTLLTTCILQGCLSSILTPDGKLDAQLWFTASEPLKGQWSLNCRFADSSSLQIGFFTLKTHFPPFLPPFTRSFLHTMTKCSLTLEVGQVPDDIREVFLCERKQKYISIR